MKELVLQKSIPKENKTTERSQLLINETKNIAEVDLVSNNNK